VRRRHCDAGCGNNAFRAYYEVLRVGRAALECSEIFGHRRSSKSPAVFSGLSDGFNGGPRLGGEWPGLRTRAPCSPNRTCSRWIISDGYRRSGAIHAASPLRHGPVLPCAPQSPVYLHSSRNNGCTGSRRGSFRPPRILDRKLKTGVINDLPPFDWLRLWRCGASATFVAKIVLAANKEGSTRERAERTLRIAHNGLSVSEWISPCTTFNDQTRGSTKSLQYHQRSTMEILNATGFRSVL